MIKQGKKPFSTRQVAQIRAEDIFGDPLKLDDELKKEIEEAGLEARFVDAKQLYDFNGYHKNGWAPYKKKAGDKIDFKYDKDPDGVIRRGTLILATRSKEVCEKHRALLAQKADRAAQVTKTHADELRQMARDRNTDVSVSEGYEENT